MQVFGNGHTVVGTHIYSVFRLMHKG